MHSRKTATCAAAEALHAHGRAGVPTCSKAARQSRARARVVARIGGTLNAASSTPAAYSENLANVVGYVLKGALPGAAEMLGLARLESGGRVTGKRAATSQNIGPAARKGL